MAKIKKLDYILDLGGVITSNLHMVKRGLLFRSSHLSKLDEDGMNKLFSRHPLKRVIDLRTDDEVKQNPEENLLPKGVKYYHLPTADDSANPAVNKENRLDILTSLVNMEGGIYAHITSLYRKIVSTELAINSYRQIFHILLDNKDNEPIVYHCTQGKDRTGILTLLILSALGVSKSTCINVYMRFNHFGVFRRIAIFLGMNVAVSPRKALALNRILTAKRKYILAAINEIETKYGSINNYLHNQIGLTDEDIINLRKQYVS